MTPEYAAIPGGYKVGRGFECLRFDQRRPQMQMACVGRPSVVFAAVRAAVIQVLPKVLLRARPPDTLANSSMLN